MNRNFFRTCMLLGASAALFVACSDNKIEPTPSATPGQTPLFGLTTPENGPGACMGTDTYNFGQRYNAEAGIAALQLNSADALNCTANDIDIATARITSYSFDGINFTNLPSECTNNPTLPQCVIDCTLNQTIYANVVAVVANSAQERYDIGVWIANNQNQTGGALTGASCDHFNLVTPANDVSQGDIYSVGVTDIDGDACGDMVQRDTANVLLGLRTFQCQGTQANPNQVSIPACLGWSNSNTGAKQRTCPVTALTQKGPAGESISTALGYRYGTTPTEAPKCNCEPMLLPINIKASLTLVKVVTNDNGGTSTVASFPLTAVGPNTISGVSGTTAVTNRPVNAGTYALSEQTVAGYQAGTWSCTGGTQSGSNISLATAGAATCTITNNDIAAHLTLVKVVTNDNGGTATTANFPLTAAGPVTITGTSGAGAVTNAVVNAGVYNLSETTLAGYTPTAWSCTSGGAGSQVTLGLGGSATCTIGNNDNAPHLTLVKVVTNDNGGTATIANFPLTAAGPATITGTSGAGAVTNAIVPAGVYNLSETTVAGYTASAWSCTSGGAGSTVTLALGASSTCTIGNNDLGSNLTLVKVVTNDNGGTATVASFPLTAAGPQTITGISGAGAVTGASVNPGVYNLSETTVAGYQAGTWSCSSGGAGSQVTLAAGGSATCTITNNDVAPRLTLVKVVTNDNGGTATTANFPLTAAGPVTITGTSGAGSVTNAAVNAGVYNLSETTLANYTPTAWSCTSGGAGSTVTLAVGGSSTCTIGNNDNFGHLTLVKVVTNDNGGTKTINDFPLRAAGPVTISGVSGSSAVTNAIVSAGVYNLSETTQAGYAATAWSCTSGGAGSQVTIALGGSATCTIGNNDQPASLTLVKRVVGIGGATFTFNLSGLGAPSTTLAPASNSSSSVTFNNLSAGSKSITEVLPNANYILTDVGCVRPPSTTPFVTGNTTTGLVSVNLTLGDNVTCTYVNQRTSATTRTQGFWATHLDVTNIVWFGGEIQGTTFGGISSVLDNTICTHVIDEIDELMGAFWSNIAKQSDGDPRSDLDKARMRLLQQLVAAELNYAAFGSLPPGGLQTFTDAEAAFCGTDITLINQYAGILATFNESGDTGAFDTGYSANAKEAKQIADLAFWDALP